jgi:REP element-mobilizing transposase RayT
MMEQYPIYWPQFYTATILEWKPLLNQDKYKQVIVESLQYLTTNNKITLYAFVIMSNHIHLIWQALPDNTPQKIPLSCMKYTAQQIKFASVVGVFTEHDFRLEYFTKIYKILHSGKFYPRSLW